MCYTGYNLKFMNTKAVVSSVILLSISVIVGVFLLSNSVQNNPSSTNIQNIPSEVRREIVQFPLNPGTTLSVNARNLPEFVIDASSQKFSNLLSASKSKIKELVEVNIVSSVGAQELEAEIVADSEKKKLLVKPEQVANFKPGLYKISLKMRTLEGEVNIQQDFAWGVIAVNTKKSIYLPDEKVQIGIGILDDAGQTQCLHGFDHVTELSMVITSPAGTKKNYSIKDKTIYDSGECTSISVTNEADFQAEFADTESVGVYQIAVTAKVKGTTRSITDYFKVESSVPFDIERSSFPTRIYPRYPYGVSFKVIANISHKGKITDILPAFFDVKYISDGGKKVRVGDFTRIVWDVNLKKNETKSFSYIIQFPMISPEFYLIGPIKIGSFTEARQWQIASDAINSTSGLVAYEDNGGPILWSRIWTGTTWSPTLTNPATEMNNGDVGDGRWFKEVSSPKTGEKIVALIDNTGGNDAIHVFTWDGTQWEGSGSPSWSDTLSSSAADATRAFDVAYEELSGDALVVYSNYSTSQLVYRKRSGGTWDGTESNAGTAYDVYKRWVRLKPQFGSDSILVGYLNNNERVGAMIWDGSSNTFGDQFSDASGTVTATSGEQAFDIAWETQSGTPMIFWGTTGNNIIMREFTGGSWQAESAELVTPDFDNDLAWVFASADPRSTSNYISLGLQDGTTCRSRTGVWTGAAVTMNSPEPQCVSASTNNLIDTAFEKDTGQAIWVYVNSSNDDQIAWISWDDVSGFSSETTEAGNVNIIESVSLYADLNTNSMMLLYHDGSSNCQLWHREWDGSSWAAESANPVHANICASGDNNTLPYGYGFDRNLERLVAYRWFANSGTVAVSSAIGTQDNPALLTTANQQFRLRLLLFSNDTIGLSLREYKLQYVDPGAGTCASPSAGMPATYTDVPTSGGSTISFYDNATPGDGNNLTANGSLDPTYLGKTNIAQDYEEANNFTNSVSAITAETETGLWDFSLVDNTAYDRVAQTYCFRVARSNDVVLQIGVYPQMSTAAVDDVLIQGGTQIDGGTSINNP